VTNVRVYKGFAQVGARSNIEVFFTMPDGYGHELATCIACGQVFALDRDNTAMGGRALALLVEGQRCSRCGTTLTESIRPYPAYFRAPDGAVGRFERPSRYPPDDSSFVVALPAIIPGAPAPS
jgi:hypothetical protein